MHLGRPGGFSPLEPRHAVGVREGWIDERRRLPRRKPLVQDEWRLDSTAAVSGAVGQRKAALVSGTGNRRDRSIRQRVRSANDRLGIESVSKTHVGAESIEV